MFIYIYIYKVREIHRKAGLQSGYQETIRERLKDRDAKV